MLLAAEYVLPASLAWIDETGFCAEAVELMRYNYKKPDKAFRDRAWSTARGWIDAVMAKEFALPVSVDYKIHYGNEKTYDAIFVTYFTDSGRIQIYQSNILMAVTIEKRGIGRLNEKDLEKRIFNEAGIIFKDLDNHEFIIYKKSNGTIFGGRNIPRNNMFNQNWSDTVQWMIDRDKLTFYFIKIKPKSPRLIVAGSEYDKKWFDSYK